VAHRDFFSEDAKKRAKAAVAQVELQTSAEIVITVKRASGSYREAAYLVGALFALVVLVVLLFHPQEFDTRFMPLDVVLGFGLGAAIGAQSDWLRRILSGRKTRQALVDTAAKAAFVDLGVSKTSGRTGLLVYVSMLELRAAFVGDLAIEGAGIADGLARTLEAINAALGRRDFPAFVAGVEALGPILAPKLPRAADDVNELSDEVR
jgi:putative membrane protein